MLVDVVVIPASASQSFFGVVDGVVIVFWFTVRGSAYPCLCLRACTCPCPSVLACPRMSPCLIASTRLLHSSTLRGQCDGCVRDDAERN